MKKRVMLYFGSFNPVHRGHIALAEYVVEKSLADEVVLIVSPRNPFKEQSGLAPEMQRFEMVELAVAASRYPEQIKASSVEFLLPKPSYTIDTLRFLEEQCGDSMEFSILMGGDQIARIEEWKEWEEVLKYSIYVYPREGADLKEAEGRFRACLDDAPMHDISSTEVRAASRQAKDISAMVHPQVAEYIRKNSLWNAEEGLAEYEVKIHENPDSVSLYMERGEFYLRLQRWGDALNDFNRVAALDPACEQALQYKNMIMNILEFRHNDTYNP